MLRRLFVAALLGVSCLGVCGLRSANAQTVSVYDAITGASSFTLSSSTPRFSIGQVLNLGNTAATGNPSNISLTGSGFSIVSTTAQTATNVTVTQYFWGGYSLATSGTTPAYSNLITSVTYGLGTQTFTANQVKTFNGTFGTNINLNGLTSIGFSEVVLNNGVGDNTLIPVLTTYPTNPAIGSNALVVNSNSGFYQNISATSGSTGNFVGSDARVFTNTNAYLAVRLTAAAPEPASLTLFAGALLPAAGVVLRKRYRRS